MYLRSKAGGEGDVQEILVSIWGEGQENMTIAWRGSDILSWFHTKILLQKARTTFYSIVNSTPGKYCSIAFISMPGNTLEFTSEKAFQERIA